MTQRNIFIYSGDTRDGCRILIGKLDGTNNLGDVSLDGLIEIKCIVYNLV